jgi:myo-inositol-1(or 4)-monophosphatase
VSPCPTATHLRQDQAVPSSPAASADPRTLLDLAVDVAREAAALVARGRATAADDVDRKSSPTDVVTAVDRASEDLIVRRLLDRRPEDGTLGEEGAARPGTSGVRWVIDPIDGTVNFLYGLPVYAVSIAAEVDGEVRAGVVLNAATGELFTATLGGGAYLVAPGAAEPVRLAASGPVSLEQTLVGTGFSYRVEERRAQGAVVARLLTRVRDIRRLGSSALDLCSVAAGRLDAYYEQGLKPWDHAAAGLIAAEAGVVLSGLPGTPFGEGMAIAAAPSIAAPLIDLLVELVKDPPAPHHSQARGGTLQEGR